MNNIVKLSSLCSNSKYLKWYISLVTHTYPKTEYTEKHHILPKSLGGDNLRENIIRIPARVHYICHKLLVRMVTDSKDKKKMIHALNMLAKANNSHQHRYHISSKEYESIRKKLSESMSGSNNPMFGKPAPNRNVTHTKETKKLLSEISLEYFKTHSGTRLGAIVTEETKVKQRGPKSETAKQNMAISAKQKPRITCIHCGLNPTTSNHTRWHGDKCKQAP